MKKTTSVALQKQWSLTASSDEMSPLSAQLPVKKGSVCTGTEVHSPDMTKRRHYACVRNSLSFSSYMPLLPWMASHPLWYVKEPLGAARLLNSCLEQECLPKNVLGRNGIPTSTSSFPGSSHWAFHKPSFGEPAMGILLPSGRRRPWLVKLRDFQVLKPQSHFQLSKYPSWAPKWISQINYKWFWVFLY